MRENPGPQPHLQQALSLAKFDPGTHEVLDTFSASP